MKLFSVKKEHRVYTESTFGHNFILAPTQVGKTTNWVNPQLEAWMKSPEKPHIIVTDPKAEIFSKMALLAMGQGYDVKVFNLKDPNYSHKYNLLEDAYDEYWINFSQIRHLLDFDRILKSAKPLAEYYQQLDDLDIYLDLSKVKNKIDLIGEALIKDNEGGVDHQPYFKEAPRMLVKASITYLLEISILKGTKDKFNLQALNAFLSSDAFNVVKEETNFYSKVVKVLPNDHLIRQYYKKEDLKNLGSFLITANEQISNFSYSIGALTSSSDFNYLNFTQDIQPTILFVLIPTIDTHLFDVTKLLIEQLTDNIIREADKLPNRRLPRRVEFMLEELGQLPKINKIANYLSEGLSRNFRYSMVLQSRSQLLNTYGDHITNVIISNCHNKIFFQNNEREEQDWISKQFNQTTKMEKSTTGKDIAEINPYWHEQDVDLVTSFQVGKLERGEALILTRTSPLEARFIRDEELSPSIKHRQINEQQFFSTIGHQTTIINPKNLIFKDAIRKPWD